MLGFALDEGLLQSSTSMGFTLVSFPFAYLGHHLGANLRSTSMWKPLKKIQKRIGLRENIIYNGKNHIYPWEALSLQ